VVLPLTHSDLSGLSTEKQTTEVKSLAAEDASKPFNLSEDVLLRVQLIKLSDREHVVLFNMHHIVSDGWSVGLLIKEFSALYKAYVQGEANPLSPLSIQYADYSQWQRNWLQNDVLINQLNYWKEQLHNIPLVHNLPLDKTRPAKRTFVGKIYHNKVDKSLAMRIPTLQRCRTGNRLVTPIQSYNILTRFILTLRSFTPIFGACWLTMGSTRIVQHSAWLMSLRIPFTEKVSKSTLHPWPTW